MKRRLRRASPCFRTLTPCTASSWKSKVCNQPGLTLKSLRLKLSKRRMLEMLLKHPHFLPHAVAIQGSRRRHYPCSQPPRLLRLPMGRRRSQTMVGKSCLQTSTSSTGRCCKVAGYLIERSTPLQLNLPRQSRHQRPHSLRKAPQRLLAKRSRLLPSFLRCSRRYSGVLFSWLGELPAASELLPPLGKLCRRGSSSACLLWSWPRPAVAVARASLLRACCSAWQQSCPRCMLQSSSGKPAREKQQQLTTQRLA
mmetsp:Transcript_96275/g.171003  ORF Transcript_96275/g.171003 Transcript_96275/m.171003 type:complete len:253 (+) Transcript_96275:2059-2817(+)